jgi:uncharacterized damage-inducible protein DinB
MPTTTMTELDSYRVSFAQEGALTRRVLRAFPADKTKDRPCPSAQSAHEIAWTIVLTMMVVEPILAGELVPTGLPEGPKSWQEILDMFDRTFEGTQAKLARLDDTAMNGMVRMPAGPKTMGEVRRGDALRLFLHDQIHHRGQLAVQLRMAGGKVPAIYGGSGDEPWF